MNSKSTNEENKNEILLIKAATLAVKTGKISTSLLQRKLMIGYGRAAKVIDKLIDLEYVARAEPCKPNLTIVSKRELQNDLDNGVLSGGIKLSITVDEVLDAIDEETKMTFEKFCTEIEEIFDEIYSDVSSEYVAKLMKEKEAWLREMFAQQCSTGDAAYELRMLCE